MAYKNVGIRKIPWASEVDQWGGVNQVQEPIDYWGEKIYPRIRVQE